MKSKALNGSSKLKMYKSVIRSVATYGCETWTVTKRDEQLFRIFEHKMLRKIFLLVKNADGTWRVGMDHDVNSLINSADIVRFIKSQRIRWLGHVMKMKETRTPEVTLNWK